MLYLVIIAMIALLGALAYWQHQQEKAWLAQLNNPTDDIAEPSEPESESPLSETIELLGDPQPHKPLHYTVPKSDVQAQPDVPAEIEIAPTELEVKSTEQSDKSPAPTVATDLIDVTHIQPTSLIFEDIKPEPVADEANDFAFELLAETTPEIITPEETARNLQLVHKLQQAEQPAVCIDRSVEVEEEIIVPEREIISSEEATRFLHKHSLASSLHTPVKPDVIIKEESLFTPASVITSRDPALHRVRQRTLTELAEIAPSDDVVQIEIDDEPLKKTEEIALDTTPDEEIEIVQAALLTQTKPEEIILPTQSVELETIHIDGIKASLHRQRLARQQTAPASSSDTLSMPSPDLDVIPAREVWANLSNTRLAPSRLSRKNRQESRPAPTPSSLHTITPIAGVAVAEVAAFPASPIPAPEIVEPVSFAHNTPHAEEFAAHFFAPKQPAQPKSPIAAVAPAPIVQAASSSEDTTWLDDSSDTLNEADFAAYYAQQEQAQTNSTLPPLTLLQPAKHNPAAVQSPEALLDNSIVIEEKLAEYKVKVKVLDAYAGPVITRYEIEPDVGVRGNSVINLEKDLARSLGVASIRVVETIPGKTCMGLELPNPKRQMIGLREVLDSEQFARSTSKLTLALGQDISGNPVVTDLAKAPHLLVAGTTGSGKSVGVNSMILSMLYKATPEEVRMIMIDPKMLELSVYEGIPHLLAPVVTDMKLAANALTWCVNEMEKRYRLMSHVGVRNLDGYNQKIAQATSRGQKIANPFSLTPQDPEPLEKLPSIVVVVDEFADLMMVAGKQIEQLIARLAQKARAAGIHLILATQRPSVDVITGLIKANIPTRIAFQVSSKIDSRTVLDQMGAENLLGQGDMLFLPPGVAYPQRVHGAFVADNEVHAIVDYLKQFGEPDYIDDILMPEQDEFNSTRQSSERDPLFDQAVEVIVRTKKASISSLQRHLRIGYNKAATLIDQLEAEGIVSAADHSGKRTILARGSES
ncbi:DNA translocase FtsK [Kingella kingae]|uniref:DNA translocase FtsK n=1 Tax=Kingella kingae TaxID=504 RepID=UPI00050A20D9|nr:DNA translocase FtsK [Kingella kingae]MDK4525570.1 DNA translocase FtsK [Kingella kingae]MDK4531553.1 DNA translocase FtsK [Kingella kingae]